MFAGSTADAVGPITTAFVAGNGSLAWLNAEFEGGRAAFYRVPPDVPDGAVVWVRFRGEVDPEWAPVEFEAKGELKFFFSFLPFFLSISLGCNGKGKGEADLGCSGSGDHFECFKSDDNVFDCDAFINPRF